VDKAGIFTEGGIGKFFYTGNGKMKFSILYVDPPWQNRNGGSQGAACNIYNTMSIKDLCDLPVSKIGNLDSFLFLWACWPMLPEALELMKTWGYEYKTGGFVWIKARKNFNPDQLSFMPYESLEEDSFFGLGNYTRANSEVCLLGRRGGPERAAADVFQVIFAPLTRHSEKPPETRDRIVRLCGDLPRIEIFARQKAEGWESIGNEITGRDIREDLDLIIKGNYDN